MRILPRPPAGAAAVLGLASIVAGCVVVPVTQTGYDARCRQVTRHITLEPVQIGAIAGCSNQGCQSLALAAAVSVAASTIVSGSVAVVGNVAYWIEERGGCHAEEAVAPAPPSAPRTSTPDADDLDPSPAPVPRPVPRPVPSSGTTSTPSSAAPPAAATAATR